MAVAHIQAQFAMATMATKFVHRTRYTPTSAAAFINE